MQVEDKVLSLNIFENENDLCLSRLGELIL